MLAMVVRATSWILGISTILVIAFLGFRVYRLQQGPQLEPWHLYAPKELTVEEIDKANWEKYVKVEDEIFASLRTNVSEKLAVEERVPFNRYFEGSPVNPDHFVHNWNRSYLLLPKSSPIGAVVCCMD